MPKYRVRVTRTCTMVEEGFIEVEADNTDEAYEVAERHVEDDSDSVDFSKEWLENTEYDAVDVEPLEV